MPLLSNGMTLLYNLPIYKTKLLMGRVIWSKKPQGKINYGKQNCPQAEIK